MILLTVRIISFVMRLDLDLESIQIHCEILVCCRCNEAKTRTKLTNYCCSSDGGEGGTKDPIFPVNNFYNNSLTRSSIANNR